MVAMYAYPWVDLYSRMESLKPGDRVRYSDKFLETCNSNIVESCKSMEGTVMAIHGNQAQIDFGSRFRASSMVDIANLQKL
jgi:hypothetical protein